MFSSSFTSIQDGPEHDQLRGLSPGSGSLKRKFGFINLVDKREESSPARSPVFSPPTLSRHQDFPSTGNIHSIANDLKPWYLPPPRSTTNLGDSPMSNASDAVSSSRNGNKSPAAISDASTPSVSCFPLPPNAVRQQQPRVLSKIYHLRGASFDIINPRQSLDIENIETPADVEDEAADYFTNRMESKMASDGAAAAEPTSSPPQHQDDGDSTARSTPQRSLFDDLQSAYASITSRSGQRGHGVSPPPQMKDLPLPPTPIYSRDSVQNGQESAHPPQQNALPRHNLRPSPTATMRRRLSRIMRLGKSDAGSWKRSSWYSNKVNAHPTEPTQMHLEQALDSDLARGHAIPIQPYSTTLLASETEIGRNYYDDGFVFNSADRGPHSDQEIAHSLYFRPVGDPQSFTSTSPSRDESTGEIIASYGYDDDDDDDDEVNASLRSSFRLHLPRRYSLPAISLPWSQDGDLEGTNSTIGRILDIYHHPNDRHTVGRDSHSVLATFFRSMPHGHSAKPRLNGSSSGLSPTRIDQEHAATTRHARSISDGNNDQDIRMATARALRLPRRLSPPNTLPADPSVGTSYNSADRPLLDTNELLDSTSATSYGETRNLLLLSDPPPEVGQGILHSRSSLHCSTSDDSTFRFDVHAASRRSSHTNPVSNAKIRHSSSEIQVIIDNDLNVLSSRLSGAQQINTGVFLLDARVDNGDDGNRSSGVFRFGFDDPGRHVREQDLTPPLEIFKRASTVPVAAFAQTSIEPGFMRLTPAERGNLDLDVEQSTSSSSRSPSEEGSDDGNNEKDWETIAESRRTLRTDIDSFADHSSLNSFGSLDQRSGESRLHHSYRFLPSPLSGGAALLPMCTSRRFGDASQDSNAIMSPNSTLYIPYRHPAPLTHECDNPFTSSPPQITDTTAEQQHFPSRTNAEIPTAENTFQPPYTLRWANLSIIPEVTENCTNPDINHPFDNGSFPAIHSSSSSVVLTAEESVPDLGSEPGPEVSLYAEQGSPTGENEKSRPRSTILSSGADAALLSRLRQNDPRMGSSPLSDTNSFNKLVYLGPKANLTGTPDGTGMREVGSSIIRSSSPFAFEYGSGPPTACEQRPTTPPSVLDSLPSSPPFVGSPSSPLVRFDQQRSHGVQIRSRMVNDLEIISTTGVAPVTRLSASLLRVPSRRAIDGHRRFVQKASVIQNGHVKLQRQIHGQSPSITAFRGMRGPLLPLTSPSPSEPHLRLRYRSPSSHASDLRHRKRKISWTFFALCALFPYLLILYGHGGLDGIMAFITNGDIRHFGKQQQRLAKILGWSVAAITVLILVIVFIVIRTVPNSLPRW